MGPPYPVIAVSNTLLKVAWEHGATVTPMKLQKLVYMAHGWHLALTDVRLIDSQVEAWQFGPVISSLYNLTKRYGSREITELIEWVEISDSDFFDFKVRKDTVPAEDETTWRFLRRVWDLYGRYSAVELSAMTHEKDTPWYKTWFEGEGKSLKNTDIPVEKIKTYFKGQVQRYLY